MSDFIAKYGIFSGIGVVILTVLIPRIIGRFRRQRALPALHLPSQPLDVEVIPLWFQVFLNQQIPDVRVYVQVVNYSKRELQVSDVTATYLRPDEGPAFENIPGGDYRIPPRRSWQVTCRRTLLDAETKAVSALPRKDQLSAGLEVRVRGVAGKKPVSVYSGARSSGGGSAVSRRTPRSSTLARSDGAMTRGGRRPITEPDGSATTLLVPNTDLTDGAAIAQTPARLHI